MVEQLTKSSKHFLSLGDKRVPTKAILMSWCPKMDLLAVATSDNKVRRILWVINVDTAVSIIMAKSVGSAT